MNKPEKKRKLSLASRIIIGVILGIGAGLFFGELTEPVTILGEAFIMLLQMPVLPYVFLSLIVGIGGFDLKQGGTLAGRLGIFMLVLWILTLIPVILIPLTFPDWESASFFSAAQVERPETMNFLNLYIPTNPFHALSHSIVPAVVLFSIILGAALSTLRNKDAVIRVLNPLTEALATITNWVVRFAPYGVFALVAGLAGSMDPEMLSKLEVFLWDYTLMALLLSLWIFPGLVSALTPVRYSQVLRESKDALVTAFATGNLFVVLPMLVSAGKRLLAGQNLKSDENVEVVVPTAFSFPNSGKLLTLSFVLFAGWFSGFDISFSRYPGFLVAGTFSFFGGILTAIPFMLDLMQVPSDLFQLFLPIDNVITNRFGVLLAAVFILVLTLLSVSSVSGLVRFQLSRILRYLVITILLLAGTVLGLRFFLGLKEVEYTRDKEMVQMYLSRSSVPSRIFLDSVPPGAFLEPSGTRREAIRMRGYIRVGFLRDHLPGTFVNESGDLVGSDIEMAHVLAGDLGVTIEFVRVDMAKVAGHLDRGEIDILMTGTSLTMDQLGEVAYTTPYQEETLAFIVRDHLRSKFADTKVLRETDSLKIGVYEDPYHTNKIRELLPDAEVVSLQSPRPFFRGQTDLDALAYTAESGGAWTIIYPEFSVAVPSTEAFKLLIAYAVPSEDQEWLNFINTWIHLKQADGTFDSAFSYWAMGRGIEETREARWSVIRNVLGWVE